MNSTLHFEESWHWEPSNSINTTVFLVPGVRNTPGVYNVVWGPLYGQYLPKFDNVNDERTRATP